MTGAFRGERLHIAILGRCNTGKSTLLNLLAGQNAAIVSPEPGTTGDPVPLSFELHPLGPVTLYDTAGLDETSELGALRREAGRKVLGRADLAVVVTDEQGVGEWEKDICASLKILGTPFLLIFNKVDLAAPSPQDLNWCAKNNIHCMSVSASQPQNPAFLRKALVRLAPDAVKQPPLVKDILTPGGAVICVTPIDASAPKGRLIAPQVQTLRELVDNHHPAVVVQHTELSRVLELMREPPDLVITDSQVVREVAAVLPQNVRLTTFSILFARFKGDFNILLAGAGVIDSLPAGAPVLIAEACAHHAQNDDIARVKIPMLLKKHTGREFKYTYVSGHDFPPDLNSYSLVIMCGGCMLNPGEMRRRLRLCAAAGVPITNFGMVISLAQGALARVVGPLKQAPGRETSSG